MSTREVKGYKIPAYDKHFGGFLPEYQLKQYMEAVLQVTCMRVAVDAGGHIGIFSDRMAKVFEAVHTFEPNPTNFECLKHNLARYKNVTIHNVALSDTNGTCTTVQGDANNSGDISIDPTQGDIPRRTLDSFNLKDVGFIKIDTQGHETQIIRGARDTLQRCRPVMLIELPSKELVGLLDRWGFAIYAKHGKDVIFKPKD